VLRQLDIEQLLTQVGEAQKSTFIVKDLEHRYVMVNEVFAQSLGLSPDQIIGKNDLQVGIPERMVLGDPETGFPGFWALDDAAIASGLEQSPAVAKVAYKEGFQHTAETSRMPLVDADGQVVGLLIQAIDVSDVVNLHESLARNVALVEQRDGQLLALDDALASLMTHKTVVSLQDNICQLLVRYTRGNSAYLWLVSETQDYIESVAGAGAALCMMKGRRRCLGQGLLGMAGFRSRLCSSVMQKTTRILRRIFLQEHKFTCLR